MERSVESACQCQVSVLGMGVGMNTPLMVGVRNVCTAMHTLCEFYVIAFDTHSSKSLLKAKKEVPVHCTT